MAAIVHQETNIFANRVYYKNIVNTFQDNDIPFEKNLSGFAANGASVMFGKK
jgi:hypothetical protein